MAIIYIKNGSRIQFYAEDTTEVDGEIVTDLWPIGFVNLNQERDTYLGSIDFDSIYFPADATDEEIEQAILNKKPYANMAICMTSEEIEAEYRFIH